MVTDASPDARCRGGGLTRTMFTKHGPTAAGPSRIARSIPTPSGAISRCCGGRAVLGLPLGARGDVGAPQVGREVPHARPQRRHDGALAAAPARALGGAAP